MNNNVQSLIIAICGASGAIYGIKLLELLKELNIDSHLIISSAGKITITHETEYSVEEVISLAKHYYNNKDISCSISSGSFNVQGMIIAPCTMKTLGTIAHSIEDNLISRAAGVTLKERRKLVLLCRETPLHAGHLENMLKVTNYGGIIAPPIPAFYNHPMNIDDIVHHSISRVLDLFGIDSKFEKRWQGVKC
jgi:4-hydroxy-3-polyprenylbenzoate decarboxylase